MKLAFFDFKSYDQPGFDHYAAELGWEIKYYDTRLNEDTASLAAGYDAVCAFVNDTINASVVNQLVDSGVKCLVMPSQARRSTLL